MRLSIIVESRKGELKPVGPVLMASEAKEAFRAVCESPASDVDAVMLASLVIEKKRRIELPAEPEKKKAKTKTV